MENQDWDAHAGGYLPPSGEKDVARLFARAREDAKTYFDAEKTYFKTLVSARLELAIQPALAFAFAGSLAMLAAIALTLCLGLAIGAVIGNAWGFLVVAAIYSGAAAFFFVRGRKRLRRMLRLQVSKRAQSPDADWAPPQ